MHLSLYVWPKHVHALSLVLNVTLSFWQMPSDRLILFSFLVSSSFISCFIIDLTSNGEMEDSRSLVTKPLEIAPRGNTVTDDKIP